ncbi:transcriptional regulator, TetR family [Blastococcus haudaquaticus]|uniref:Transcriptional regulator, TetR family n=1 Tax=Blastococcus haudaquaticus TaxID=1938745 RepID=A0A286GZE6_9ACTN|nr:transcriptional regulator, TetR family [Blastococcus haudaquaticus]
MHHYFGNKDKLFLAAIEAPADPADLLPEVLAGGRDDLGRNVVRLLLRVWDGPMQPAALALVRSAIGSERTAKFLREFLVTQVLRRVVGTLDMPAREREIRGALAASQLIGLVVGRYVLKLEPLATASPEWLATTIGPNLQRYLTGPIELPDS